MKLKASALLVIFCLWDGRREDDEANHSRENNGGDPGNASCAYLFSLASRGLLFDVDLLIVGGSVVLLLHALILQGAAILSGNFRASFGCFGSGNVPRFAFACDLAWYGLGGGLGGDKLVRALCMT